MPKIAGKEFDEDRAEQIKNVIQKIRGMNEKDIEKIREFIAKLHGKGHALYENALTESERKVHRDVTRMFHPDKNPNDKNVASFIAREIIPYYTNNKSRIAMQGEYQQSAVDLWQAVGSAIEPKNIKTAIDKLPAYSAPKVEEKQKAAAQPKQPTQAEINAAQKEINAAVDRLEEYKNREKFATALKKVLEAAAEKFGIQVSVEKDSPLDKEYATHLKINFGAPPLIAQNFNFSELLNKALKREKIECTMKKGQMVIVGSNARNFADVEKVKKSLSDSIMAHKMAEVDKKRHAFAAAQRTAIHERVFGGKPETRRPVSEAKQQFEKMGFKMPGQPLGVAGDKDKKQLRDEIEHDYKLLRAVTLVLHKIKNLAKDDRDALEVLSGSLTGRLTEKEKKYLKFGSSYEGFGSSKWYQGRTSGEREIIDYELVLKEKTIMDELKKHVELKAQEVKQLQNEYNDKKSKAEPAKLDPKTAASLATEAAKRRKPPTPFDKK